MITVDDFGISKLANKLVEKALKAKAITHVSVMTNMPGSKQAFEIIKKHPGIKYGLHLNLTEPLSGLSNLEGKIDKQIKTLDKLVRINFINSHHHIHLLPLISNIVVKLAKHYRIEYIRRSQKIWFPPLGKAKIAKALAIQIAGTLINSDNLKSRDYFVDLDWLKESDRLGIVEKLPSSLEIACHPLVFQKGLSQSTLQWLLTNKNKLNFR